MAGRGFPGHRTTDMTAPMETQSWTMGLPVQESQRPAPSQMPWQAAPDVKPNFAENIHFVDKHMEAIIQGVNLVSPILDRLYSLNLLTTEKYQTVTAKETPQKQMRQLYMYMQSWSRADKEKFYEALQELEIPLIRKLSGQ